MILYRIAKKKYAEDLSGYGAKITGGRWNRKGLPALYLAESRSLSILEIIVHCNTITDLNGRILLSIEIPDKSMDTVDRAELPDKWNMKPYHSSTVNYGSNWLISNQNLLLKIPSAIVPEEYIFIANPKHKKYSKIKIIEKKLFEPDQRLVLLETTNLL